MSEPQQAGYPHAGYPQGYPEQPTYPQPAPGSMGRAALIVAIVALVIGLVLTVIMPFAITSGPVMVGLMNLFSAIIQTVVAVTGLIIGIIAISRRAQPVLAGIAVGITAAIVLSVASGLLNGLLFTIAV